MSPAVTSGSGETSETGTGEPGLRGAVHQNVYVVENERLVQALITVDSVGELGLIASAAAESAEVIMLDLSGSMNYPAEKKAKAAEAAAVAIDELRDGTWFAVVGGYEEARMVWPRAEVMVRADRASRDEAKRAVYSMVTGGGTRIGEWLRLARRLLAQRPSAIRHAILLTDGINEHESPERLDEAIELCQGQFTCDCRGVGADWSATELRKIANGLLGSVDRVARPAGLVEDFRAMIATSMTKRVADVALRLWTPAGAVVRLVKQTAPNPVDLTARRTDVKEQIGHYPTGSWGAEQRDFHICVEVPPAALGQERLAARVSFVALLVDGGFDVLPQRFVRTRPNGTREWHPEALISAIWTNDFAQYTEIDPKVAVATGRSAIAEAVRDAMRAYRSGDGDEAARFLQDARRWAAELGDDRMYARIDDLLDPETGTFRLDQITPERELEIEMETDRYRPQRRDGQWANDGPGTERDVG